MVFLSIAMWFLLHSSSSWASDAGAQDSDLPDPATVSAVNEPAPYDYNRLDYQDAIDATYAAPNRSPAVLPSEEAAALGRQSMYLDYSAEAPAEGSSASDNGAERLPTVVDDQR